MDLDRAFELIVIKDTCVFDIGSFKGTVAGKLAFLTGREGSVYAFEPHPIHYFELSALAEAAYAQHGLKVFPYCKAMSDRVGHTTFHLSQSVDNPSYNQASSILTELANQDRLGDTILHIKVETDTLDEFCRKYFLYPSFMKIDTEGADPRVILGGARMIEQCRPALISEFGYDPKHDLPTNNIEHLKFLENVGYELFMVDIMSFKDVWTSPGWPYLSDNIFRFRPSDLAALPGTLLTNVLALPRKNPAFDSSPIRQFIAPVGALQFLSNPQLR